MLYKYNQKKLEEQIYTINASIFTKVTNYDQKNKYLEVLLYNLETKYEIYFYMDISPYNNNFQKRNSKIKTPGIYSTDQINYLTSKFLQSYIPERHDNLTDFFQQLKSFLDTNLSKKEETKIQNQTSKIANIYSKVENSSTTQIILITLSIHIFVILLKIIVGLYGYSGEKAYPKYGDFEAQRHWMELTIYLKPEDWYTNSRNNRADYWPLDYPPMSGYHSYILGKLLEKYMPDSVTFKKSMGYESPKFKLVMRFFALISDLLVFHIGVNLICFYFFIYSKNHNNKKVQIMNYYLMLLLILINPLMIIIDHGHFQFNNVMHGFFVISLLFLYSENFIFAIIFFSFCVNFKQMGLYYAIPFPLYVIKKYFFENKKNSNAIISLIYIGIYAIVTLITNMIIYLPWLRAQKIHDVMNRIFPVHRGIYEDKVATFWCVINIFYKLNKHFNTNKLIKLSLFMTVSGCLIPIFAIFKSKKLSKKICTQCFFIISFSFYLFSFHVHEKTILVPFLAYLLNLPHMIKILPSFTLISMFSLFPLLKRENQIIPYYFTCIIFYLICKQSMKLICINKKENKDNNNEEKMFLLFEISIFIIMLFYHFIDFNIPPPKQYPWFYPMLNAAFCFCFFIGVFLYANYNLIKLVYEKNTKNEDNKVKVY